MKIELGHMMKQDKNKYMHTPLIVNRNWIKNQMKFKKFVKCIPTSEKYIAKLGKISIRL